MYVAKSRTSSDNLPPKKGHDTIQFFFHSSFFFFQHAFYCQVLHCFIPIADTFPKMRLAAEAKTHRKALDPAAGVTMARQNELLEHVLSLDGGPRWTPCEADEDYQFGRRWRVSFAS